MLDVQIVQILLTNDDGIYAPGLAAMERALARLGDVCVVAPAVEQSGVGHSITFLSPLMAKEVFDGERRRGWAVEGSPADCVKLAIAEFCPRPPDLVVSGINGGLNLGINVLYSGTVAGATEGALFGITSSPCRWNTTSTPSSTERPKLAVRLIEQILKHEDAGEHLLYNINIPTVALERADGGPRGADGDGSAGRPSSIAASTRRAGVTIGRWARRRCKRGGELTDLEAWQQGYVTLTPLRIDRTEQAVLERMRDWKLSLERADR